MAAVSQRASGIPQPVSKTRGPSRLTSMQSQFQQREAADRQKKLAQLAPARTAEPARPAAAPSRTVAEPGHRSATPPSVVQHPSAPARGKVAHTVTSAGSCSSSTGSVPGSAGTRSSASVASSSGGGRVRAMFQSRRAGTAAQTSSAGWDKSFPLEPIKKSAPAARHAPAPAAVSGLAGGGAVRRTLSDDELLADESKPAVGRMRSSVTVPEICVKPAKPTQRDREADRRRIAAEVRRRERELLAKIRDSSANVTARRVQRVPNSSKPAAAAARSRRAEPAEPRRPAPPRAAPAPARTPARTPIPASTPARPPPSAAKENRPPAPRAPPTDPNLAQCPICTRAFAKDRLDKHHAICEKSSKKKRKVFDPVKMRVEGTESEGYLRKVKSSKQQKAPPAKKDWRKQHEEFIRNIRAAKKAQAHVAAGGDIRDLPPPPPMDTSDYVQCPHCGRKFSEAAADRHIPKCANISSNKPAAGRQKPATARLRR